MKNTLLRSIGLLAAVFAVSSVMASEIVVDGGFEDGSAWAQSSTNFGTPLCTLALCGNGTGTGPGNGDAWAWFGGIGAPEVGAVSQDVQFAVGTAELTFIFENIISDSDTDYIEFRVDGNTVWSYTGGGIYDGILGYSEITVNLDAFADGGIHTIEFFAETFALNGGGTNFFVDDVSIISTPVPIPGAIFLYGAAIAGLGFIRRRKST